MLSHHGPNGDFTFNTFTEEGQAWVFSSLIFSPTNQRSRLSMAALQPPPLARPTTRITSIQKRSDLQSSNPSISHFVAIQSPIAQQHIQPHAADISQQFCSHEDQLILLRNLSAADTTIKPHAVRHCRGLWREDIMGICPPRLRWQSSRIVLPPSSLYL